MTDIHHRLGECGLALPVPPPPSANYVPFRLSGRFLFVAGQTCIIDEVPVVTGTLGRDLTIEQGQRAAEVCALNTLAQVGLACGGDFDRVTMLKLTGFIRSTDDFDRQPKVLNGASDLFVLALGEPGRHARAALGTNALPRHSPVEIETVWDLAP